MKKFVSILLMLAMLFAMSIPSFAQIVYWGGVKDDLVKCDPLNNELFDIVAQLKPAQSAQGEIYDEHIDHDGYVEGTDENGQLLMYYPQVHTIVYMDGSVVTKKLITIPSGTEIYPPNAKYIKFEGERNLNEYIMAEGSLYGNDRNIYKVIIENEKLTSKEIVYSLKWQGNEAVTINKATETNGVITETPYKTLTADEFDEYTYDSGYGKFNDGLAYNEEYHLVDMNGEIFYFEGQESYHTTDYNLGYLNENYNNGWIIDWSLPNAEDYRTFDTMIHDVFNDGNFFFENAKIDFIRDDGYSKLSLNDGTNKSEYIIKLKRPAIVTVYLDGEKIKFDQLPVIENGRTLVPLRAIFDALGAEIAWDGNTQTVTAKKSETEIKLTIDSKTAYKNGEMINLDVPAKLISGRTMVPARFVADCFGVNVDWDGAMQRVLLTR